MTKMLFQLSLPIDIAKAKEDMGINNIWKYLRYIRMYLERTSYIVEGVDLSYQVYNTLLWNGVVALVEDKILGTVVCKIVNGKKDANDNYIKVDVEAENGYKRKNVDVEKECVIIYSDVTRIPPIIYLWAIANEIIAVEDIIRSQDNMLRKPILIKGIGEDSDNATVKASNVLSGVSYIQSKSKGKNVMDSQDMEVLNLQVGNSYKAPELWNGRKNREELICDYLGYTTVKNEKRERMNTTEVTNENSVGMTFYESFIYLQNKSKDEMKSKFNKNVEIIEHIKRPEVKEEEKEDVSIKEKMD